MSISDGALCFWSGLITLLSNQMMSMFACVCLYVKPYRRKKDICDSVMLNDVQFPLKTMYLYIIEHVKMKEYSAMCIFKSASLEWTLEQHSWSYYRVSTSLQVFLFDLFLSLHLPWLHFVLDVCNLVMSYGNQCKYISYTKSVYTNWVGLSCAEETQTRHLPINISAGLNI